MRRSDHWGKMVAIVDRVLGATQLRKNAFSGGAVAAGNILLIAFSYPIYLTYLGAEWYGLWAALSVVIALSQTGNLGIHHAVGRHVLHVV